MLLRYVHKDFSITNRKGDSYVVPKGHIVATSPSFAHRLPHVYKRVDEFDPDRFGPGREEDKVGAMPRGSRSMAGPCAPMRVCRQWVV